MSQPREQNGDVTVIVRRTDARAEQLAIAHAVSAALADARTFEDAFARAVEAVFAHTTYSSVTATLVADAEQVVIADHSRAGPTAVGLRRPVDAGLCGVAIRTAAQLHVPRSRLDARYDWPDETVYESLLLTPVTLDGDCIGIVELCDPRPDVFADGDAELMASVATQLATALRGVRLHQESERRAARLAVAASVARAVAGAGSMQEAWQAFVDTLSDMTDYVSVAVVEVSADGPQRVAARSADDPAPAGAVRPAGTGLTGVAAREQRQIVLGRATSHPAARAWSGTANDSLILTPVVVAGECVAVVQAADRSPDAFDEADTALMRTLAEQLASTLLGIRLAESARRRAEALAIAAEVGRLMAAADSPRGVLRTVAKAVHALAGYPAVTALLMLPTLGEQELVAAVGVDGTAAGSRRPIDAGVAGRVSASRRAVLVADLAQVPDRAGWEDDRFNSLLSTPVAIDGARAAVIEVASDGSRVLDDADATLMTTIAEQTAAALRGARLREEADRRAARLELTAAVARDVASADTIQATLQTVVDAVFAATDCDSVAAIVVDVAAGEQVVACERGRVEPSIRGMRRPLDTGVVGRVLETGEQVVVARASGAADYVPWVAPLELESALLTPVMDGSPVAVLALLDRTAERFDEADATLMRTVAEQVAATLRGVRLREQSEARANRLTVALRVARAVGSADTVEEALRSAAAAIHADVGCDSVTAFVPVPDTDDQVALVDIDTMGTSIEGLRRPIGEALSGKVFATGRQVLVGRASELGRNWGEDDEWTYESALLTPVAYEGRVAAVIALYASAEGRYDDEDAVLMRTICEHVAAALRLLEVRDQSEARASRLAALERRQRELLGRLMRAQEEERSRVAADLHDDTIQVMSACVLSLDAVRVAIEQGATDRAAANLREVAALVSGAVERTRRMTFDLRPAVLWHQGLVSATEQALRALEREAGVSATLTASGLGGRVDATAEAIVFRSITEALANVRAHARATAVRVHLERSGKALVAEIRDDGRGFDLEPTLRRDQPPRPRGDGRAHGRRRRGRRDHDGARRGHRGAHLRSGRLLRPPSSPRAVSPGAGRG